MFSNALKQSRASLTVKRRVIKEGRRMSSIAVYQFASPDPDTGQVVVSSRFATLKAIKVCNGRSIEESRRLVDTRELDANGFYQAPAPGKAGLRIGP
jgi:hypothetical protein